MKFNAQSRPNYFSVNVNVVVVVFQQKTKKDCQYRVRLSVL